MFEDKLNWAMTTRGLDEEAFDSLLRDEPYLSDNKIFAISRFINKHDLPIFLSRKIGSLNIICRKFDKAITYTIKTSNPCCIDVDFKNLTLIVTYQDEKISIYRNLSEYNGNHSKLMDIRQAILNEILIRYFAKILNAMYKELGWF
jgi:hypothetical protein